MNNKKIYFDHAATTQTDESVVQAMLPYFTKQYGNASSLHQFGRQAKEALEESRESIAKFIGAKPSEIIFTSGGSESNNLTLKGLAYKKENRNKHIITSKIEHHAIEETCKYLEKQGFQVTYVPVDKEGLVDPEQIKKAITKDTFLVSIMHANNELGTIEPIEEIGKICKEKNIPFHTDAVQTVGKLRIDVKKLGVDLLSSSAHKLYGPKGVGFLYKKEGIKLDPLIHGGGHEHGARAGTENIPGIIGFAKAVELADKNMEKETAHLSKLGKQLQDGILAIEKSYLNGHKEKKLAGTNNFRFDYIEGESLILRLDAKGIAASTGSACSTQSLEPSHVLKAIGLSHVQAHGSLRLSLGKDNTEEEVKYAIEEIPKVVVDLRKMSPLTR